MATRKTNKTSKGSSKRESDFDADKFLADWDARERQPLPEGAIRGMPDKQPHPDMHYDVNHWAWIPNNPQDTHNDNGTSIPSTNGMQESKEQINGISVRIVEPVNSGKGENSMQPSTEKKAVQSEQQCTTAPGKPIQPRASKAATDTVNQPSALDNPIVKEADEIPVSAPVIKTSVAETHSQSKPDSSDPSTVEQSKKSRISAKKVDADFDDLCRDYIHQVSLGEKKPVFLPLALRDRLDDIARLSGDRRVSASHIVINIVTRWIDANRDTLNRKISNKDFSI